MIGPASVELRRGSGVKVVIANGGADMLHVRVLAGSIRISHVAYRRHQFTLQNRRMTGAHPWNLMVGMAHTEFMDIPITRTEALSVQAALGINGGLRLA